MTRADVFFYKLNKAEYTQNPFNPNRIYPELERLPYKVETDESNEIYSAVREILINLGLDRENVDTELWNPFKEFVQPGQKVLIKPNLVFHEHPHGEREVLSMVTNAAVVRPIIDYVLLATGGDVELVIGDCPVQGADFKKVTELSGMKLLQQFYNENEIALELKDMRMVISKKNAQGVLEKTFDNPDRTMDDFVTVDLKDKSELMEVIEKAHRFEITDYKYGEVNKHHTRDKNEYRIPKEVLEADFIINMPKLKTHRKAGVTCALKNLVGVNGDKTCIAHHTRGYAQNGGDEFSTKNTKSILKVRVWNWLKKYKFGTKIATWIKIIFTKTVWHGQSMKEYNMEHKPSNFTEGNWYGNDTIWRCVKDLNKIIYYADRNGQMHDKKQRSYLCVVDAILAGEGEGPMEQTTKPLGVVFGGLNPVYIDYTATKLMKYDYRMIPLIRNCFENKWWTLVDKSEKDVMICGNVQIDDVTQYFIPSYGWQEKLKSI